MGVKLTKENITDLYYGYRIKGMTKQLAIDKALGELYDYKKVEEELKCPLDFCITPYSLTGLKKIWYRKQWCDVVRIVIYEEATRPYMEVRVKELKNLKIIFLDNYGETWALTKEELDK